MRLLTVDEFKETMGSPMVPVEMDAYPPVDFSVYFEQIPAEDFQGHDCAARLVQRAYRDPSGTFEHVLFSSEDPNVFMVLVLDVCARVVFGHHLLNLNEHYGLDRPSAPLE